jgi:hypothetical protein
MKKRATLIKMRNGRHRVATRKEILLLTQVKAQAVAAEKLQYALQQKQWWFEDRLNELLKGDLSYALPEATRDMMIEKLIGEIAERFGQQIADAADRAVKSYGRAFVFETRSVERFRPNAPLGHDIFISGEIQPFRCYIGRTR